MKGYHKIIDKYNKNQLIEMVEYIIDGNEEAKLDFLEYCQNHAFEGSRSMVAENQVELHWESAAMIIGEFDLYGGGDEADEDVVMHPTQESSETAEIQSKSTKVEERTTPFKGTGFRSPGSKRSWKPTSDCCGLTRSWMMPPK